MTGQLSDKKELTWREWEKMESDSTVLVDLREEVVYHHGSIPGAVCIPLRCLQKKRKNCQRINASWYFASVGKKVCKW